MTAAPFAKGNKSLAHLVHQCASGNTQEGVLQRLQSTLLGSGSAIVVVSSDYMSTTPRGTWYSKVVEKGGLKAFCMAPTLGPKGEKLLAAFCDLKSTEPAVEDGKGTPVALSTRELLTVVKMLDVGLSLFTSAPAGVPGGKPAWISISKDDVVALVDRLQETQK